MTTIFTRIIDGEIPGSFVMKDERWVAFLDINPVAPGHILLVPRQEAAILPQLGGASLAECAAYLARLDAAIRAVTSCDAVSIPCVMGPLLGRRCRTSTGTSSPATMAMRPTALPQAVMPMMLPAKTRALPSRRLLPRRKPQHEP